MESWKGQGSEEAVEEEDRYGGKDEVDRFDGGRVRRCRGMGLGAGKREKLWMVNWWAGEDVEDNGRDETKAVLVLKQVLRRKELLMSERGR